ncbi:hypothetical protein SAMN00777080_3988 [Aquiflexum balticum DSM 16537]|uniref:Uncharacterized protein n=1 Tax=Aquiflexum balticum DSM 16537 TaxID=758820 RepID=A0A1W2H8Z9_9BACT|nr:hypothetical protein [Aquiflexum balticum]SMD45339.1 hypothetical protein SAMN00777080_3988 [Aquiflexum balticum DSM 16537]
MKFGKSTYRPQMKWSLTYLLIGFAVVFQAHAQRISFSTWTGSDDINILSPQGAFPVLDFSQKKRVLLPNSEAVGIELTDNQAVIFEIEAPEGFDLTVEVDAPIQFVLSDNPSESIPFQLRMAYNNQSPGDEVSGKLNAIELPLGFNSISFPVNRNSSGLPAAPPSPEFGGITRPKTRAYLYFYGNIGPIGNVAAGRYEGEININVSFVSND